MEKVDTRALTKHIRCAGAMKAIISTENLNTEKLIEKARCSQGLVGRDLVKTVTCKKIRNWNENGKYRVLVIDCGVKHNILRELAEVGCQVIVAPAAISLEKICAINPDGLLLSNGPGDPAGAPYVAETIRKLNAQLPKLPMMGICLGHQILSLAFGGKTYKLKFGHRGANQPVKDLQTGKVEITSQNHGFCVDGASLNKNEMEVTHINLNDQTAEGIRHKTSPVFSVQYHPEASPGPYDTKYLFNRFIEMVRIYKGERALCQKEMT